MTCCASASLGADDDWEAREWKRSMAPGLPSLKSSRSSLACFLRCSRLGFAGSWRDITPPSCRPESAITGRSEVDVRNCQTAQVGSSLPADGMHPAMRLRVYYDRPEYSTSCITVNHRDHRAAQASLR